MTFNKPSDLIKSSDRGLAQALKGNLTKREADLVKKYTAANGSGKKGLELRTGMTSNLNKKISNSLSDSKIDQSEYQSIVESMRAITLSLKGTAEQPKNAMEPTWLTKTLYGVIGDRNMPMGELGIGKLSDVQCAIKGFIDATMGNVELAKMLVTNFGAVMSGLGDMLMHPSKLVHAIREMFPQFDGSKSSRYRTGGMVQLIMTIILPGTALAGIAGKAAIKGIGKGVSKVTKSVVNTTAGSAASAALKKGTSKIAGTISGAAEKVSTRLAPTGGRIAKLAEKTATKTANIAEKAQANALIASERAALVKAVSVAKTNFSKATLSERKALVSTVRSAEKALADFEQRTVADVAEKTTNKTTQEVAQKSVTEFSEEAKKELLDAHVLAEAAEKKFQDAVEVIKKIENMGLQPAVENKMKNMIAKMQSKTKLATDKLSTAQADEAAAKVLMDAPGQLSKDAMASEAKYLSAKAARETAEKQLQIIEKATANMQKQLDKVLELTPEKYLDLKNASKLATDKLATAQADEAAAKVLMDAPGQLSKDAMASEAKYLSAKAARETAEKQLQIAQKNLSKADRLVRNRLKDAEGPLLRAHELAGKLEKNFNNAVDNIKKVEGKLLQESTKIEAKVVAKTTNKYVDVLRRYPTFAKANKIVQNNVLNALALAAPKVLLKSLYEKSETIGDSKILGLDSPTGSSELNNTEKINNYLQSLGDLSQYNFTVIGTASATGSMTTNTRLSSERADKGKAELLGSAIMLGKTNMNEIATRAVQSKNKDINRQGVVIIAEPKSQDTGIYADAISALLGAQEDSEGVIAYDDNTQIQPNAPQTPVQSYSADEFLAGLGEVDAMGNSTT